MQNPASLSDEALVSQAHSLCGVVRKVDVQLIVTLMEVENRRRYLGMAYSSMWDFCQRKLGMSEGQSYRRLTAARLVRDIPELLGAIERGEVTVSNLVDVEKLERPQNLMRHRNPSGDLEARTRVARDTPPPTRRSRREPAVSSRARRNAPFPRSAPLPLPLLVDSSAGQGLFR